jgi:serine/threonine-protein kinase
MDPAQQPLSPSRAASIVRQLWHAPSSSLPPSIPAVLASIPTSDPATLADALAADAHERLSRGLAAEPALYTAADPSRVDNPEVLRAILMCHATARADLDAEALRGFLLALAPGSPSDVNTVARLASLLRDAANEHERALKPGLRLGKYELKEPLGSGSFGDVWRAWDFMLHRYVALKVLKPGSTPLVHRRFEAEARAAASIQHPNVVAVHDAGVFSENGRFYIDAELAGDPAPTAEDPRAVLPARSLSTVVTSTATALHWRDAARITAAIARGTAAAHARAVLHRDIKPANILLTSRSHPMLADFGLSVSGNTTEAPGRIVGTPAFMAPEQALGLPATPLSDVYSIGATLVFLTTGTSPPDPSTLPASAPREFHAIVARAAAPNPADRYLTAEQLARDLDALLEHRPVTALRAGPVRHFSLWYRRHAAIASVTLSAIILLAALGTKSVTRIIEERNRAIRAEHAAQSQKNTAERARTVAEATTRFMEETLGAALPASGSPNISLRAALIAASDTATRKLDPDVLASVKYSIGRTLAALSVHDRAERDLNEAISLRTAAAGPRDRDTLLARHARAGLDLARGRPKEARDALLGIAADTSAALPPDDVLIPASLDLLGQAQRDAGDLPAARTSLETALALRERILGPDHPETLATLRNLGTVYLRTDEPDLAIKVLTRAYESTSRVLGANHHLATLARQDLGTGLSSLGRPEQARPHLEAAFGAFLSRLGPGHINTLVSGANLASVQIQLDEHQAAVTTCEAFIREARAQNGESNPYVLRSRTVYASALYAAGHEDIAITEYEATVAAALAAGPARAADLTLAASNLARIYDLRKNTQRAAELRALIRKVR